MTNPSNEEPTSDPDAEPGSISDEQLPEDLRPSEDNPLAQDSDEEESEDESAGR